VRTREPVIIFQQMRDREIAWVDVPKWAANGTLAAQMSLVLHGDQIEVVLFFSGTASVFLGMAGLDGCLAAVCCAKERHAAELPIIRLRPAQHDVVSISCPFGATSIRRQIDCEGAQRYSIVYEHGTQNRRIGSRYNR